MPDIIDLLPADPPTNQQRRLAEAAARERELRARSATDTLDTLAASVHGTFPNLFMRMIERSGLEPDPSFSLDQKTLNDLSVGVDDDLRPAFGEAISLDHARAIAGQLREQTDARRTLESSGMFGIVANAVASITDPAAIAVGLATGGVGSAARTASVIGRLGIMARSGLVAGVSNAALEEYRATQDPSVLGSDIIKAGLGGFGFAAASALTPLSGVGSRFLAGGVGAAGLPLAFDVGQESVTGEHVRADIAFNAGLNFVMGGLFAAAHTPRPEPLSTDPVELSARRMIRDAEFESVKMLADASRKKPSEVLTDAGRAKFSEQIPGEPQDARLDDAGRRWTADTDIIAESARRHTEIPPRDDTFVGPVVRSPDPSAEVPATPPPKGPRDLFLDGVTDAAPAKSRYRFDMPATVGDSPVPAMRIAANLFGPDPLPKADGSPSVYTATEWAQDTTHGIAARFNAASDAAYGALKRDYAAAGKRAPSRTVFDVEVSRAVRRPTGAYTDDPNINAAADAYRTGVSEVLDIAHRHGVAGFDEILADDSYVTRLADREVIDDLISKYGERPIVQVVADAIGKNSQVDASPGMLETLARAWVRHAGLRGQPLELARARIFAKDQTARLERALADEGMTPEQIDRILYVTEANPKTGPTRARRRLAMDETHVGTLPDGRSLSIESMLVNNSRTLFGVYARQMVGAAALSEGLRTYNAKAGNTGTPIASVPDLLSDLAFRAEQAGLKPQEYARDIRRVEAMVKVAAGLPLQPDTALTRVLRVNRNLQFLRTMSNIGAGIQNFGEIISAVHDNGVRTLLRQLPAIREIITRGKSGELENRVLREMELLGQGVEFINRHPGSSSPDGEPRGVLHRPIEELSGRAARLAADVSGQSLGTVAMQRINGLLIADRLVDSFRSAGNTGRPGDGRTFLPKKQLAALGIGEPMAVRIAKQVGEHVRFTTSDDTGNRLRDLNFDAWTDVEAASALRGAMSKLAQRQVQSVNEAELSLWMTTPVGKVISQLRRFAFGAWTKKFLYATEMGSAHDYINWGVQSAAAMLTWVARVYLASAAMDSEKARKYREDNLSVSAIAKASFSRAGWSSLIPTGVDAGLSTLRRPPAFAFARSSSLNQYGGILSNPTADWAAAAWQIPAAIQAPLFSDYRFSKQDVRNIRDGLWIPNIYGLRDLIDGLSSRLPDTSTP